MSAPAKNDPRLRVSAEDLCDVLERLRQLHEQLLELLAAKESALIEIRIADLDELRHREEQLLRRLIEEEKERLLLTEELGVLLGHENPAAMRVREIMTFVPDDLEKKLAGRRESLRSVALRLARQNAVNRALIEHSMGHIQVFFSKLAAAGQDGSDYDHKGAHPDGGGGSFLMDRRV